jgi:hypothetical protein
MDFEEALKNWTEGVTTLRTPTFQARLEKDGTLWLSGAALQEGFSVEGAQALTRFLMDHVEPLPLPGNDLDHPVDPNQNDERL